MKKIAVLNGPNLDRLGKREPHIYGSTTLAQLEEQLRAEFAGRVEFLFVQSNHEGVLIDTISRLAGEKWDGLVMNAASLTHTSVGLRDAVAGSGIPLIEVHISNVYKREEFRHQSFTAPVAVGMITGLGLEGYFAAIRYFLRA